MSSDNLKRLRYYKGQLLTARDFEDQQNYHIEKLRRHVSRFPHGIIRGLDVEFDDETENFFLIQEGLAVDMEGLEIEVPKEGLKVPKTDFHSDKPYLSIEFDDEMECADHSICENKNKYNRVVERAKAVWDRLPNSTTGRVTIAQIKLTDDAKYEILFDKDDEGRQIRIDAKLFKEEDISFKSIAGHDHSGENRGSPIPADGLQNKAVTTEKIDDDAITSEKIDNDAITSEKIDNDAVTSAKIAEADGETEQNTNAGSGIKTDHIQDEAVTEDKIYNGAVTENKIYSGAVTEDKIYNGAVTEDKIDTGAVTSDKIAEYVPPPPPGDPPAKVTGIRTVHIQPMAVTLEKLAPDVRTLLGADAITSDRIAEADNALESPPDGIYSQDTNSGSGIKTAHITNDAITSAKIAEADNAAESPPGSPPGTISQDTNSGSGIKTDHIQNEAVTGEKIAPGAVTSDKIAWYKPGLQKDTGIQTEHIRPDAVTKDRLAPDVRSLLGADAITSERIAEADGTTGQNTNQGSGVKTNHIQDEAISEDKIRQNAITSSKIDEADGTSSQNTNQGSGVKTGHIQDNAISEDKIRQNAVTSSKIAEADSATAQNTNQGSGIKTGHIQDGAVTVEKLSLNRGSYSGTIAPLIEFPYPTIQLPVNHNRLVFFDVIPNPISGRLSWVVEVLRITNTEIRYYVKIKNNGVINTGFNIRVVVI